MIFKFAPDIVNNDLNYLHLESTSCRQSEFKGKNKKCIYGKLACNIVDDCGDKSDENLCGMSD